MTTARVLQPGDETALSRFLERHPDTTMFLRGNLADAGLVDQGRPCEGTWAAAFDGEAVVGAGALFWNGNLIVEAPVGLETLVRCIAAHAPRPLRGIIGRIAQTRQVRACLGLEDAPTTMDSREVLMALDLEDLRVPSALAAGTVACRRASGRDMDLLLAWSIAYNLEALGASDSPALAERAADSMQRSIADGRLWLLEDRDRPLAMTGFNCVTADCVQVGGVYTPPALRGRGHARAAVAGSLLDARGAGARRSILFTEEENASALACYRGLGYGTVGDYSILLLRDPQPLGA